MDTYPGFGPGSPVPNRDECGARMKDVFDKHGEELVHNLYPERGPHVGRFGAWITSTVECRRKRQWVRLVRRECAEMDLVVVLGAVRTRRVSPYARTRDNGEGMTYPGGAEAIRTRRSCAGSMLKSIIFISNPLNVHFGIRLPLPCDLSTSIPEPDPSTGEISSIVEGSL